MTLLLPPDLRIAMVLAGGNALGAYQAGVYEALHGVGISPDWVVGTSVGAINGAIIAGNAPSYRLSRLSDLWRPEGTGAITVSAWDGFVARMKALAECPVDPDSVEGLLRRVLTYPVAEGKATVVNEQALANARALYEGGGRGAMLASSRGTAWGLLNSVTEFVDHHRRARSDDHRRDAAWFGQGAQIKKKAWESVLELVS